jgi:N-acetylglucosamine kinase-like BadF-type ATPase
MKAFRSDREAWNFSLGAGTPSRKLGLDVKPEAGGISEIGTGLMRFEAEQANGYVLGGTSERVSQYGSGVKLGRQRRRHVL